MDRIIVQKENYIFRFPLSYRHESRGKPKVSSDISKKKNFLTDSRRLPSPNRKTVNWKRTAG